MRATKADTSRLQSVQRAKTTLRWDWWDRIKNAGGKDREQSLKPLFPYFHDSGGRHNSENKVQREQTDKKRELKRPKKAGIRIKPK